MAEKQTYTQDGVDYTIIVKDRIAIDDVVEHLVRNELFNVRQGGKLQAQPVEKSIKDALLKRVY